MKTGILVAALLLFAAASSVASECREFAELTPAAELAKNLGYLGKSEADIVNDFRINLWSKPAIEGKQPQVGQVVPGSRVLIVEKGTDDYKVKSPLDGSVGWIQKEHVKRTAWLGTATLTPCRP